MTWIQGFHHHLQSTYGPQVGGGPVVFGQSSEDAIRKLASAIDGYVMLKRWGGPMQTSAKPTKPNPLVTASRARAREAMGRKQRKVKP